MSARSESPTAELERYRLRCQDLETYLCDLQLEIGRLQRVARSTQVLLDARNAQAASQQTAARLEQRRLLDQLAALQQESEKLVQEAHQKAQLLGDALHNAHTRAASLETALEEARRDALTLRKSMSWRITGPARWLLRRLRGY